MSFQTKASAVLASTALIFTGFTPAIAAPIGAQVAPVAPIAISDPGWTAEGETVHGWRGNRGYRGYRGYRGRGHRRHRGRIDGGDVLAGLIIFGGIAAIASAASKKNRDSRRDDRYENRDYRNDSRRYDDRRSDSRADRNTGSIESAINVCSNAAEQSAGDKARVSEIRSVTRDGAGWRVEGDLTGSEERTFLCGSTEGRVDFVQLGTGELALAN